MRLFSVLSLAGLLSLALFAPAQDSKPPSPKDPPTKSTPATELPADLIERIDAATVTDLKQKVARAQIMLSRDGQNQLRVRVRLETVQQQAEQLVKLLTDDSDVKTVQQQLQSSAAQNRIAEMVKISDEKKLAEELGKFLQDNSLSQAAVVKYGNFRDAEAALQGCQEGLRILDKRIEAGLPRDLDLPGSTSPGRMNEQVQALLKSLKQGGTVPVETTPVATPGDLRTILESLRK